MGGPVERWRRRRSRERMLAAALGYAAQGWPVCPGAHSVPGGSRACSCDRVGCPSPAAHPVSPSWQTGATADPETLRARWAQYPDANVVLPTGRVFDVLDVPAGAGTIALDGRFARTGLHLGPVAACGAQRYYFFVATRGAPDNEEEWWQSDLDCHLDAEPETVPETEGLRWHCRDSYVVAPPSALPSGHQLSWIRGPGTGRLPDPLLLLETLAEACHELGSGSAPQRGRADQR